MSRLPHGIFAGLFMVAIGVHSLIVTCGAQDVDPQAKEELKRAILAMRSDDLKASFTAYQQAISIDPNVQAINDRGVGDWLLTQMRSQASDRSQDADFQRDFGYMLQFTGDYDGALSAYKKAQAMDPSTDMDYVKQQITTLESWVKADSSQQAVDRQKTESSQSAAPAPQPEAPSGPDPKDEEIKSLQNSLRAKDDQIKALNEEKAKLAKTIEEKDKEVRRWRAMASR